MKRSLWAVILAGAFLSFSSLAGADWELISSYSGCGYYYDPATLTSTSGGMKKVWILKKAENYDCVRLSVEQMRLAGEEGVERFEKYRQTKSLAEFNCSARRVRFETTTLYDRDGRIMRNTGPADWSEIPSEMKALYDRICR